MNKIQTKIIKYIKIHQNTAKTEIYRIRRNESRVRSKSRGHFNTREILQFNSLTQNLIVSELLTRVLTVRVKSLVMSPSPTSKICHQHRSSSHADWSLRAFLKDCESLNISSFLHIFRRTSWTYTFSFLNLKWRMDTEIDKWLLLSIWI